MDAGINPIPDCQMTWVFGLLETLEDRGGREDGYKIARDLQFKFTDLLKVMKTAEILELVSTPVGDVVLEPLGKQFLGLCREIPAAKARDRSEAPQSMQEKIRTSSPSLLYECPNETRPRPRRIISSRRTWISGSPSIRT